MSADADREAFKHAAGHIEKHSKNNRIRKALNRDCKVLRQHDAVAWLRQLPAPAADADQDPGVLRCEHVQDRVGSWCVAGTVAAHCAAGDVSDARGLGLGEFPFFQQPAQLVSGRGSVVPGISLVCAAH